MAKIKNRVKKWEAKITFIFFDDEPCDDNIPCKVRFINGGKELVISFNMGGTAKDDEITFRGKRIGDGHWKLLSDDDEDDIATLHKFPGDNYKILEGYLLWNEEEGGQIKKMWRIQLNKILK